MAGDRRSGGHDGLAAEAKETSGVTSALLLAYVERVGGPAAVHEVLRRCGLQDAEAELRDENSWFSWETKIELFQTTADVLEKPDFLAEMAASALDVNVAGGLKVALRTLGSPQFVIRNIVRANARFVRSHKLELQTLEPGHAVLRFSEIGDRGRHHPLDCGYTAGLLAVIPCLFGLPAASVKHDHCAAEGAPACLFELRWQESRRPRRRIAAAVAASAGALIASLVLSPVTLPAVGVTLLSAAYVAEEAWRWNRGEWRHLQRQIEDSENVNQRLFESLQDLVSDLRLEEVVAKVTRNAQAAVGGKDFLLLVRDGDGLICQSSSDLQPGAVAAVETWANGTPQALRNATLIDDVSTVESLAPLATLPDPLCTLACAPLTKSGEPFGLLVSLGGQQQTFLPRDMSVLESYAAQVSIALGNAQLYANERSLAACDPLTGLLNHRSFHEALDRELERCAEESGVTSFVLLDLDHFKQVNDEDGHAAGDLVLRAVARALSDAWRQAGSAFRIGGDEFALLLPGVSETEALEVAERACEAIGGIDSRMAASAGVACAGPGRSVKAELIDTADRRLYGAKHSPAVRSRRRGRATSSAFTARMAIDMLIGALELHHASTVAHSGEVAQLAENVAARLGVDTSTRDLARQVALLHDLGKLAVPREVLDKPGPLTDDEWELVRRHPAEGADVLARVRAFTPVALAVRASHERWDGGGYPDGLRGKQIPLVARIVAVCDAFEAMTEERPYRAPKTVAEALCELRDCAGSQFDPAVVEAVVAELAPVGVPS